MKIIRVQLVDRKQRDEGYAIASEIVLANV